MAKKKDEITIRSSAAEYLTYVASVGDQQDSIEIPTCSHRLQWLRPSIRCCGSLLTKAPLCDGLYAANAADKRRKLCFRSASGVA